METVVKELGVIIYATLMFAPPLIYAALGSCFSEVPAFVQGFHA